jgi:hypothetical protein
MSNSIVITGSKELLNQKNIISDTIKNTYNALDENINLDINNENYFSWLFSKYTLILILIIAIIFFILYNNDITIDYIIKYFVYGSGETIKQTVDSVVTGAKSSLNTADVSIDNAVNIIESSVGIKKNNNDINNNNKNDYEDSEEEIKDNDVEINLNKLNTKLLKKPQFNIPEPDSTSNNIKKKAGYCYIGEDRGFRSCAKVSQHDTCMSGDIFPTRDICINPNLRH